MNLGKTQIETYGDFTTVFTGLHLIGGEIACYMTNITPSVKYPRYLAHSQFFINVLESALYIMMS